jgi:hypothetical protein
VTDAAPGRVLGLSLAAWGLGELAMGRRYAGSSWLLAEVVGLAVIGLATWLLRDTTWYLVPFVLGMAFIGVWPSRRSMRTGVRSGWPGRQRHPPRGVHRRPSPPG